MATVRRPRRALTALGLAITISLSWAVPALAQSVPDTAAAEAAAAWLADELVDGERIQSTFEGESLDAPGATADTVFALAATGVGADAIGDATDWLASQAPTYAGSGDDVMTGAIGKLLLVAAITDRDPRDLGGVDLLGAIEEAEVTEPDTDDPEDLPGRYRDVGEFGDFSTPLTHALVLLGLERTPGIAPSSEAVALLLDQQCADGGFPDTFQVPATDGSDPTCTGSVDTTGYAVQTLDALDRTDAVAAAVDWLMSVQAADGSFGSADGPNTNSTGLAAVALAVGDGDDAAVDAARAYIVGVQDGCDDAEPGAIPFNAEDRGFTAVATAQAIPGLLGVSLADVDASGASATVPPLGCPPTTDADADDADDEDGDDASSEETPRPTRVDSGLSPSGSATASEGAATSTTTRSLAALGTALLLFALLGGAARHRGRRDAA